jgi:hypothetical protein
MKLGQQADRGFGWGAAVLALARYLDGAEPPLPDQMGFICRQAAEKYLKAFFLAAG